MNRQIQKMTPMKPSHGEHRGWAQVGRHLCVYYAFSMNLASKGSPRAKVAVDPFDTRRV